MSKKFNSLIILLLPLTILWSCITGPSDDKKSQKVAPSDYAYKIERAVSAEVYPVLNSTPHLLETESRIDKDNTRCKVMGVADGDTLTCLSSEKVLIKARLNQIDAPEHKRDFGKAAKKALSAYFLEGSCCLRILYIRNYNFNYKNS